jgi:putative hydrolase of the HAD superfamily
LALKPQVVGLGSVRCDAALLDAAGTLIRPREPVGETYAFFAQKYGARLEPGRLMKGFVDVFADMPDLAFRWTSTDELQRLERDWWRTLVFRVVAWAGVVIGDFDAFFDDLYEHYSGGRAWECFPEVTGVLGGLRARGIKIAVVSNFDSRLPGILVDLGIRDPMDAVVYSSGVGSAKPEAAIFQQALDVLGVAPSRAIHVGDSVSADVGGAAAAGVAALLIRRDRSPDVCSEQVIRSLDELIVRIGNAC